MTTLTADSVTLVVGAGSGLGQATARLFAEAGHTVMAADLDGSKVRHLASEIGAQWRQVDVTDESSVEDLVKDAAHLGTLRAVVNTAGVGTPVALMGRGRPEPLDRFGKVLAINLLGTINVLRCSATQMASNPLDQKGDRGVCVNTASIAAFDGQAGMAAYAASKAGVAGLTLPAARELSRRAIRVVTVAPGYFETPMMDGFEGAVRDELISSTPHPRRAGEPREFAALVQHIVDNPMINGETIRLDGALRM